MAVMLQSINLVGILGHLMEVHVIASVGTRLSALKPTAVTTVPSSTWMETYAMAFQTARMGLMSSAALRAMMALRYRILWSVTEAIIAALERTRPAALRAMMAL